MYKEVRKIHLIEELLKVTNETTLTELEILLKKSGKKAIPKKKKPSIYDFVGIISKRESSAMRKAIKESCEIINPDDWK